MHGASNSAAYYRNREQAERMQAAQAVSDKIRQIHLTMAERYREFAERSEMSSAEPSLDLPSAEQTAVSLFDRVK